jgi:signal transduction histidine kinase
MQHSTSVFSGSSFESAINPWSLSFLDPLLEREYQRQRAVFKHITKQMKIFFLIGIIMNLTLTFLDVLSAFVTDPDYTYEVSDVIILILYIPIGVCEYLFYKFKAISFMRGSIFTCFIYLESFYGTSVRYYSPAKYPLMSPTALLWCPYLTFLHTFYVSNWVITFLTYTVILIELLVVTFLRHGERLVRGTIIDGTIDILYYSIIFIGFIGISIYCLRIYEQKERTSFFYEWQSKKETEKWRTLLNDLPEPVILAQDGVIAFYNTATQKFFNLIPETTNMQLMQELDKLLPLNSLNSTIATLIKNPRMIPNSEGFTYRSKLGRRHKLQIKYVVVDSGSGPQMTEFIFHDVTMVEELEREKTQRYCSNVLVGTASHEIRTPINAIKVVLGSLSDMATTDKQQEEIKIAHVSMNRLELYVKELALLQQLEAGTLKLNQELFNPNDVVDKTMEHFSYAAKTRGLSFKLYENSITSVTSDKEKYEIIVYHMIENALKYTSEGGISIRLGYSPEEDLLFTSIIDTGGVVYNAKKPGFKLFSPKDDLDFTGPQDINLGLFLADSLAIVLGGKLKLESLMGIGTRALVSIKCNFEEANEEDVQEENPIPRSITMLRKHTWKSLKGIMSSIELTKPGSEDLLTKRSNIKFSTKTNNCCCSKILIVDDESFNVFVLKKYMIDSGLQADVAMNGRIAIDLILKRKEECRICKEYRIIFMDINMPIMNGITTMLKIKELINNNVIPEVPVIAVTATVQLGEAGVIEKYKSYGFKQICNLINNCSAKTCG